MGDERCHGGALGAGGGGASGLDGVSQPDVPTDRALGCQPARPDPVALPAARLPSQRDGRLPPSVHCSADRHLLGQRAALPADRRLPPAGGDPPVQATEGQGFRHAAVGQGGHQPASGPVRGDRPNGPDLHPRHRARLGVPSGERHAVVRRDAALLPLVYNRERAHLLLRPPGAAPQDTVPEDPQDPSRVQGSDCAGRLLLPSIRDASLQRAAAHGDPSSCDRISTRLRCGSCLECWALSSITAATSGRGWPILTRCPTSTTGTTSTLAATLAPWAGLMPCTAPTLSLTRPSAAGNSCLSGRSRCVGLLALRWFQ